ncbi:MAG: DUF5627 domain-containing protein [Paludibacter sp.]|nr:DUF5627 domain-containing protein [Paludibacter sp.]MDD4427831.1 DUF5627 domain-containing protein [Paludibacter sp.]
MKKILIVLASIIVLASCKNQDINFPDFDYTTAYFPYQYPVRTLVLGDYIYDNTNDNNHKFIISAAFGGVYANEKDRVLSIQPDESLCNRVLFSSTFTSLTDTIRVMPASYYSLSSTDQIVISKGKFNGGIEVQLNDAFFDDPLSIKLGYVIPLRIVASADIDSILRGKGVVDNPDPRIVADWSVVPKDFTMFAVKYINPYEGKYFNRGVSVVKNLSGSIIEETTYRTPFIEQNKIWQLKTTGRQQVSVQSGLNTTKIRGSLDMLLNFTENGDCTIQEGATSRFKITGTGKFVKNADTWGNQDRNAIYLDYQLTSGQYVYSAKDTLVIRDRGVVLETYTPKPITDN